MSSDQLYRLGMAVLRSSNDSGELVFSHRSEEFRVLANEVVIRRIGQWSCVPVSELRG